MGNTAWAAALMIALAVVIAVAFILLWVRDKDRADEVADDPERADTDTTGADSSAWEGAAEDLPPDIGRERRH